MRNRSLNFVVTRESSLTVARGAAFAGDAGQVPSRRDSLLRRTIRGSLRGPSPDARRAGAPITCLGTLAGEAPRHAGIATARSATIATFRTVQQMFA